MGETSSQWAGLRWHTRAAPQDRVEMWKMDLKKGRVKPGGQETGTELGHSRHDRQQRSLKHRGSERHESKREKQGAHDNPQSGSEFGEFHGIGSQFQGCKLGAWEAQTVPLLKSTWDTVKEQRRGEAGGRRAVRKP